MRLSLIDVAVGGVLTVVGFVVRFVDLADPSILIFDEAYYARDACWYVLTSPRICQVSAEQSIVNPPLGKWLIGLGIASFGYNSFGWRMAPLVAGTLTIPLMYVVAKHLLNSTRGATVATFLLTFDLLHFVQSRVAMVDIFVPFFGLASILFTLQDRSRVVELSASLRSHFVRPWRLAAGIAAGSAVAVKWSGLFYLVTVVILTMSWEMVGRRKGQGSAVTHPWRAGATIASYLLAVPLIIYAATYAGRLGGSVLAFPWDGGSWLRSWWDRQRFMYEFHTALRTTHDNQSPAWAWPFVTRPVGYFFSWTADQYREVLAFGNRFVWLTAVLGVAYTARACVKRRDWRGPEAVIVAGFVLTYVPWLLQPTQRTALFLFYLLPAVPFMYWALGYVAVQIGTSWQGKTAIAMFAAMTMWMFAFFYPLAAGRPLTPDQWRIRIGWAQTR